MTEVKPCPFCGLTPNPSPEDEDFDDIPECLICVTCQCFDSGMSDTYVEKPTWNTRPIEDALAARVAELEAAVEYTSGRNPVIVVVELQQRIRQLEAQLTRLHAASWHEMGYQNNDDA